MAKEKDISRHACAVGERNKLEISTGEHMRRSLTITPENDKKILLAKGSFLTGETPFDIDYTTLVNIFVELGHKVMSLAWNSGTSPNVIIEKKDILEAFKKHAFSTELKEESVGDQFAEIFFRKLVEQSNKTASEPSKQNPSPALPSQKSSSSDTKVPEYVS